MNELTDFAYAAGYIDGDGCFYIGKIKTSPFYQDTFSIISTHLENIEWFNTHFKGTIQVKTSRQKNRVPSYHFVFNKAGYEDLDHIRPFLVEKNHECLTFKHFRNPDDKHRRDIWIEVMGKLKHQSYLMQTSIKEDVEEIRNTVKPTIEDFAYLAGFIDAECSIGIQKTMQRRAKNPNYRIHLQCNNSKSPCFYWLAQRFGGQFHFIDKSHLKNRRNQMSWRLSCNHLAPILKQVLPFLKHKKQICEEMIKFQQLAYSRKGAPSPNSPKYSDFYRPILEAREAIYHKVSHLNKTII